MGARSSPLIDLLVQNSIVAAIFELINVPAHKIFKFTPIKATFIKLDGGFDYSFLISL